MHGQVADKSPNMKSFKAQYKMKVWKVKLQLRSVSWNLLILCETNIGIAHKILYDLNTRNHLVQYFLLLFTLKTHSYMHSFLKALFTIQPSESFTATAYFDWLASTLTHWSLYCPSCKYFNIISSLMISLRNFEINIGW